MRSSATPPPQPCRRCGSGSRRCPGSGPAAPVPRSPRQPPPHRGTLGPAAHLVEPVHDAPAGGARQEPPLSGSADRRRQHQGGAEQHGQGHARRSRCGARARSGAGPHGEGADPGTRSGAAPAEPPQQRRPRSPRPGPGPAGPRASIQISASAPRAPRPRALVGRGSGAKGRGPISARHASDQWEPPACPESRAGGGGRAAGARAAAIMRKGRHTLRGGFSAARHLYLAAASQTFGCRGRALPAPNMAGGTGGHVLAGPAPPFPRWRRPLRGGRVSARGECGTGGGRCPGRRRERARDGGREGWMRDG